MKSLVASASLLMLAAPPALAQWAPPDEVLQVLMSGDGDWTVRCEFKNRRDKPMVREAQGRRGKSRIHLVDATSGTCTYQAAPDAPLTIRLKSPLYRCTLPEPDKGACQQTFAPGSAGRIEVARRD